MNLVIGSAFRNSACRGQVQVYFNQVARLQEAVRVLGHSLALIAVEGDSVDSTRGDLLRYADALNLPLRLEICEHGKPEFGSTEAPERMEALSNIGNAILAQVRESDDVLFYVESDLLWRAETFLRLMALLEPRRVDVIAPLIFAGAAFYDIWGFRGTDGSRFGPFHPYHASLKLSEPTEVGSVGSCLVMGAKVARQTRIPKGEALVGFCRIARELGFRVWTDARERVDHP